VQEIALHDVVGVRLSQTWRQRLIGASTVRVRAARGSLPLDLANIHHGPQLALILQLLSTDHFGAHIDREFVKSALAPGLPRLLRPHAAWIAAATLAFALMFGVIGLARHQSLAPVTYADDDPIAPGGHRRPTGEIVAFMQDTVMPFARQVLGPLEGGAANVTCETCHGSDAAQRGWAMPGVRALPEPQLRSAGMERTGVFVDPQIRNAVYGYLAEEHNQSTAGYMRAVVMPGMARLMRRPPYDFSRTYGYNRSRAAVGCYHCHLID
jgi:hypothetical protein